MSGDSTRRLAIDIGGTFTDVVLLDAEGNATSVKVLTESSDPAHGVEVGLGRLDLPALGESTDVVHGTTLVSNALIERKGAVTGLVTTAGFRDVLTIRNELRYELYDLSIELPTPLVPRRLRWEVAERILADGSIDTPLDVDTLRAMLQQIAASGVQAVAICLLHAYVNPVHEQQLAAMLRRELPQVHVSLSSEISPELGEYERTSTTVANAYALPLIDSYLEVMETRIAAKGIEAPLHVMLSTGARTTVDVARRHPVRLVESGPAAGVLSAGYWGAAGGKLKVMAFDMGGTTAKAGLIVDGKPLIARTQEVARVYRFTKGSGLPLRVAGIDLIEIGAGGGSIARTDAFGLPKVGPDSAGASPGPACYGLGGSRPTVTDADLVLGYLNAEFFLGGAMILDIEAARRAVGVVADELGLSIERSAAAIHQVVNETMAAAARMHAIERGIDLRDHALVPTGGAGPVHAWGVATSLGITSIIFPPGAGVASALGMLTAAQAFDFSQSAPSPIDGIDWEVIRTMVASMRERGVQQLLAAGVQPDAVVSNVSVDVRHLGQGATLEVHLGEEMPPDPLRQVEQGFSDEYARLYGQRPPGVDCEVLTWRVRVAGETPDLSRDRPGVSFSFPHATRRGDALKGHRQVWFAELDEFTATPVYDRHSLDVDVSISGPAVIEERESTAIIGPSSAARVHMSGLIEVVVT